MCWRLLNKSITKALFIIYSKAFRGVTSNSKRSWVKEHIIDTLILKDYATHRCRSGAISKVSYLIVDITKILFNFYKSDIVHHLLEDIDFMIILGWNSYVYILFVLNYIHEK